jgi:predicted nucleotidyltransferase
VSYQAQDGKVGCFLRYVRQGSECRKVTTNEANSLIEKSYPQYLYHSQQFDAHFHAVKPIAIIKHHLPELALQKLILSLPNDELEERLQELIAILRQGNINDKFLGITGSVLLAQQAETSDIDIVAYGRDAFHQLRKVVQQEVSNGKLSLLDNDMMRNNFERRAGELSFEEFAWHENRKFNKAVVNGSKFDIGMVCIKEDTIESNLREFEKRGRITLRAKVTDDALAFDFPARYIIENKLISEVVVFTNTYVGQAQLGESIEVSGTVECEISTEKCRLIVGSSREAVGEYIKVCR